MPELLEVSQSRLKLYRNCSQAHHYRYVQKLEPRIKAVQLERGTILHECLQARAQKRDWREVIEKYEEQWDKLFLEERQEYGDDLIEECIRMMEGYEEYYRGEDLEYILVEDMPPAIPLVRGKTAFILRADAIVRDKRGLQWLVEHKTHDKMPTEDVRMSDLQTLLYIWALRKLGWQIDGILWDYLRTKKPAVPEVLKSGELSRRKNIDTTWEVYKQAILDQGLDPKSYSDMRELLDGNESKWYRRVYLPVTEAMINFVVEDAKRTSLMIHALQEFPVRCLQFMTCRMCSYRALCEAEVRGLDADFIREREYKPRVREDDNDEDEEEEADE